jgi:hypothetical protein
LRLFETTLRKGVDPVGKAVVTRGRRPERRPDLIRHAPEEQRADREELLDLEPLHVLCRVLERPGVLAVGVLFLPGRLHDAVERHELGCDQLPHQEDLPPSG